jgi:hypothetical protein
MAKPDDSSIQDSAVLLRALPYVGWWTESEDGLRASSIAFMDRRTGETSCFFATGEGKAEIERQFGRCRIASFTARDARLQGFNVTRDPGVPPEGSPDHVVLTFADQTASMNKYQKACKQLAIKSEILDSLL